MKIVNKIILFIGIICFGCQNPFDVTGDREKEKIGTKPMDFYFSKDSLFLEGVFPEEKIETDMKIINKRKYDIAINSMKLKWGIHFIVDGFIPKVLKPNGTQDDNQDFKITFQSSSSGEIFDTLFVNGKNYPYLYLKAIVFDAYAYDVDFGTLLISENESSTRKLFLCNNTNREITLEKFEFSDTDFEFAEDFELPLKLEANSKTLKYVVFSPKKVNYINPSLKLNFKGAYYPDSIVNFKYIIQ